LPFFARPPASGPARLAAFAFILFALFGGFIVLWRRWVAWPRLAAAAWGLLAEFQGWVCPLTAWENTLRAKAGQLGYGGGFIE
jgi:polyferredoxin